MFSNAIVFERVNKVLFVAVIAVGLYLALLPLLPEIGYTIHRYSAKSQSYSYQKSTDFRSSDIEVVPLFEGETSPPEDQNWLYIPKIGVNASINEGQSVLALEKGIWRRPKSSTPDLGSNTVLVAHRFLYTSGPNTFYHLDKLAVGDRFSLWWSGQRYEYEVFLVETVLPSDIQIEAGSTEQIVTLWTCTPLFSASKRLVVVAELVKKGL